MSPLQPEGEALRRAVRFISEKREAALAEGGPAPSTMTLIDEASLRFDLAPKDAEFLIAFFRKPQSGAS